ncbi:mfs general substrate transporter [Anaeramoeba ignava]|uniref:Mfs general substrate transporter n=1 Tax=Anaeramoeba ignava TaxID=1746090 RepID=A0A9Q0RI42_ANAIG|nr:mfs general substrate transporter [Anaeramoeba ignava]
MWGQVFVIAFSVVSDALNIIQSIPYIPFLIESFHITDSKKQVGYLAGLLMSISHICQIFSSFFFGTLSDKIGRRKIMIFGNFALAITTFLFGFTFNIWWVFLTKGLSGLLYENIGIANTILNEICSSGNQALCMSVVGFSFGIGSVGGPILGGYTVHLDAKKGSFWMDELNYQIFERNFKDDEKQSFGTFLKSHKYIFLLCLLYGLISLVLFIKKFQIKKLEKFKLKNQIKILKIRFIFIFFDTIVPLLLFQEEKDGGLDFEAHEIATGSSVSGASFLFFQILLYPKISRYISPLNAYRIGVGANALVFVAFPFINSIHVRFGWQAGWAFYLTAMVLRSLFESLTYSSTFILINNSAKSFRIGGINGIGQTISAFFRAFGPTLAGSLSSWSMTNNAKFPFNYYFSFFFNFLLAILTIIVSFLVPKWINKRAFIRNKMKRKLKKEKQKQKQKQKVEQEKSEDENEIIDLTEKF